MSNYKRKDFFVISLSSLEEKDELYQFCIKKNIPITYPELFSDGLVHLLWAINKDGVGLCGTAVARFIQKDKVLHSVQELIEKL